VVRQAWLITVVRVFLIGCAFLLAVGCSRDTGSQPSGSQDSEVSQSAEAGSERTGSLESEPTAALSGQGGSPEGESTHEATELGGSPNTESTAEASASSGLIGSSIGSAPFWLRFDGMIYDTPYAGEGPGSLREGCEAGREARSQRDGRRSAARAAAAQRLG
jgi:hypothetical protein